MVSVDPTLRAALSAALGSSVGTLRAVGGGDINAAFLVTLADGRQVFVKTRPDAPDDAFTAEAADLAWLREAGALAVPAVYAVGPNFLALEAISAGRPHPDHEEALGRGLATLHRASPGGFGLPRGNFIATLRQDNTPTDDWPAFYGQRRLLPLTRVLRDGERIDDELARDLEALVDVLPDRCGPAEPAARLHGDLWRGNTMVGADGLPVLVDPAVYAGHREIDLAMMRLFGGFSERTFAAYHEAWPLAPGAEGRVPLYQLWPLLVHVALFGGGYVGGVRRALAAVR